MGPPSVQATPVARPDTTLPPEFKAADGWSWLPSEIATATSDGPCGQRPGLKIAARMDPPREAEPGRWVFNGCLSSSGTSFTRVYVEFALPDGTRLRALIADRTPAEGEYRYQVLVQRPDVTGISAKVFVILP